MTGQWCWYLWGLLMLAGLALATDEPRPGEIEPDDAAAEREDDRIANAMTAAFLHDRPRCRECVRGAKCEDRTCKCRPTLTGDPLFSCYRPNRYIQCRMCNDPSLETFYLENTVVDVVGSTRVAQFHTTRRGRGNGKCYFYLYAMSERIRGKLYIKGLQFLLIQRLSTGQTFPAHFRIFGYAEPNGNYRWTIEIGGWTLEYTFTSRGRLRIKYIRIPGCLIRFRRTNAQFLRVWLLCCGIRFAIRPFHPDWPHRKPGMWVRAKRSHQPTFDLWIRNQQPLCLDSTGDTSISDIVAQTGLSKRRYAMTFLSLTNDGPLDYPNAPLALSTLRTILRQCSIPGRNHLFNNAAFMLTEALFIRCISVTPYQDDLVDILIKTSRWFCEDNHSECTEAKILISSRCNSVIPKIPAIQDLLNLPCP